MNDANKTIRGEIKITHETLRPLVSMLQERDVVVKIDEDQFKVLMIWIKCIAFILVSINLMIALQ